MDKPTDRAAGDPMLGRVLDGRYRIGARIARGGMATVYEATDLRLDRSCAIKIMHPGMGEDDEFAKRFVREAQSAARLAHPSVVAVFDQGDDDGTLYLVMEFVPGETLRDVIRNEAPMKPSRAVALLEPVLAALGAAHESGMIHRDIKPENVLIAPDGRIKVADFGLARAVNAETQHTATGGVLIGTVSYLAPELVERGKADARADVYAAGVLLYELLTGQKPHAGETAIQVAYKHVHEDVPLPSEVVGGIPPYVDALVARATARDLDQRPADAKVLLRLLRQVRTALDAGVLDDPDLTHDLLPRPARGDGFGDDDYDDTEPTQVVGAIGVPAVVTGTVVAPTSADSESTAVIRAGVTTVPPPVPAPRLTPTEPPAVRRTQPVAPTGPPRPPQPPRGRGRSNRRWATSNRGPILLAAVVVLALVAAVGGWYLGVARYTTTPGLIGLSTEQAAAKAKQSGLEIRQSDEAYSETIPQGSIVSTSPKAGERIKKSGTIRAVVSLGQERHNVPDLTGMTEDAAQAALAKEHLAMGAITEAWDDKAPAGQVVKTNPDIGTPLPRDTAVNLTVSKGPKPVNVDDYANQPAADVVKKLQKAGLTVNQIQDYSPTVAAGNVMAQDQAPGTVLHRGDTINLTVSQGLPPVPVPDVFTKTEAEATQILQQAGFVVNVEHGGGYVGFKRVSSQSPDANTMLQPGQTVTITLL